MASEAPSTRPYASSFCGNLPAPRLVAEIRFQSRVLVAICPECPWKQPGNFFLQTPDRFVVFGVSSQRLGVEVDMRIDLLELLVTIRQQGTEEIAQPVVGVLQQLRQPLAQHTHPVCQGDAIFCQEAADLVAQRRSLRYTRLAQPMQCLRVLLLDDLDSDKTHIGPACRLGDGPRIVVVVLVTPHIGLDVLRRDQPNRMTVLLDDCVAIADGLSHPCPYMSKLRYEAGVPSNYLQVIVGPVFLAKNWQNNLPKNIANLLANTSSTKRESRYKRLF